MAGMVTTQCTNKKNNTTTKLLNPWVLQFQKMGLELKCPLCLNLFTRPMLLPCDHVFCSSCLVNSTMPEELECAICKNQYLHQDLRSVPIVESIATIYRSLESNFSAKMFQNTSSAFVSVLEPCQSQPKSKASDKFDDTGKNVKRKYDAMPMDGDAGNIDIIKVGLEQHKECDILDVDINQVMPSPCSDQENGHGAENISSKGRGEVNGDLVEELRQLKPESSGSESEYHMGDSKRQRTICGSLNFGSSKDSPTVLCASHSSNLVTPSSELELKSGMSSGASQPEVSDKSRLNKSICSFCQSSKVSEVTGPMLHYVNGTSVSGDAANKPNVIHVHRLCIEWAPRVYFHGESIKNLKSEITRGAKLKCGRCGLKGAALGCFVNSCRRTYHAPCATEISNCRWDLENFLMLCSAHSSVKFPKEKVKTKHQTQFDSSIPQPLDPWETPIDKAQKWIFCGSALSSEEKMLLVDFALSCGATVTKYWTPEVTHVIAATDSNGAYCRTLKVLLAILRGKWVLKVDWIQACKEAKRLVDEEPYEVRLDNHGSLDGPKAGRLRAMANESMLFGGLNFYFAGDFVPSYMEDLRELVVIGGGTILESKEELLSKGHGCTGDSLRFLVVYNLDPPQGCKLGEEVSILWQRLNEAQDLAASIGSPVVGHTWLLESIASCKLQCYVS